MVNVTQMKKQNLALKGMVDYCDFMRKNDMCARIDNDTVDIDKADDCPFFRVYVFDNMKMKQCLYDHIDWATGAIDG